MTRTFKTKAELVERLMAGEKWRVVGHEDYCYYDETRLVPFRYSGTGVIHDSWGYCDGASQWEQVIDKQQPKQKLWYWEVKDNLGCWELVTVRCSEENLSNQFKGNQYRKLEALGFIEV